MRIDIVLRPRYETLDKTRFVCSGLRILEFSDFHKDLRLWFVFPLDHRFYPVALGWTSYEMFMAYQQSLNCPILWKFAINAVWTDPIQSNANKVGHFSEICLKIIFKFEQWYSDTHTMSYFVFNLFQIYQILYIFYFTILYFLKVIFLL